MNATAVPAWPVLLRAARAARQVRETVTGPGVEHEAARVFADMLSAANERARDLALTLLPTRAAKKEPLADAELVKARLSEFQTLDADESARRRASRRRVPSVALPPHAGHAPRGTP